MLWYMLCICLISSEELHNKFQGTIAQILIKQNIYQNLLNWTILIFSKGRINLSPTSQISDSKNWKNENLIRHTVCLRYGDTKHQV